MSETKIQKIQKTIQDNPDLHVKLVESLRDLIDKIGEPFTPDELFTALKNIIPQDQITRCHTTYIEFWDHYK